ncbi:MULTISPECIES: hypothetical protein [unclassified Nodularia (in: cyanobacteria)]|uniref:hypothetical protein n=1 Tax=unclassified Nodularia (in: cyanobacteria) TaxID=2656917 RepID=UPI00187E970C|nr:MULTISPECIES: hypothetical protein [unclassified Nodularia (in: cyanobacteria)]MBE9202051.1 hypothetical protein [Nodularia sp. LEGE 06071]MCC2694495.1 hypothetical protein [Nodularia sp. LEGE 04288]
MVNKIATRIQSRLSRKGLKIALGDIKSVYSEMVLDPQNPTDEEVNAVTEYFVNQLAPIPQPENQIEEETSVPIDTALEPQAEETILPINSEAQEDIASLETIPQAQTEEPQTILKPEPEETAIALQETSELVASTAESMGIALNIEDVTAIAENFDYASTNSDDELEEIKSAITAFVQHKAALSRQKIQHIVQEIKQTIHNLDAENSDLLNDGLRSISQDIKSGSERFRQQTRQALKVFALPPSKAG